MNPATKIILRQLANEGLIYSQEFGLDWLTFDRDFASGMYEGQSDLPKVVADATRACATITALLLKLQDALQAETKESLSDLLVTEDEKASWTFEPGSFVDRVFQSTRQEKPEG